MTTYKPAGERLVFLRTAVESVLSQTVSDWRLLVSENGADTGDAVARVLEPYLADPRIEHVRTGAELTGAENSTRAMSAGTALYVTLLHDDDWWEPEFLGRRLAFLEAHPTCGFVFGGNVVVDEHDRTVARSRPAFSEGLHTPEEYVPLLLEGQGVPMPPTALIRRSAFEGIGGSFDDTLPAWDLDFYLRLGARFPVGYLDVWDSAFRVHSQQYTYAARWGEKRLAYEDRIDEILREAGLGTVPKRKRRRAVAFMMAAVDAAEAGERGRALSLARSGIRVDPRVIVDRRFPVVLAVAVGGPRLGPLINRLRAKTRRRSYIPRRRKWRRGGVG